MMTREVCLRPLFLAQKSRHQHWPSVRGQPLYNLRSYFGGIADSPTIAGARVACQTMQNHRFTPEA
jgi:hypothetical protein